MLWKSIQSQFTTIQPQLKKEERRKTLQVSPKGCFLLQMLYSCKCKGLQGGTLCGPVFCIFSRMLKKKTAVLEKIQFWVCKGLFVYALKKHSIKFKTIRPQLKKGRKEKQKTGEPKGLFLYNCKCKGLQGGTLCGPVFCIFSRMLKKKTAVLEKIQFWVCKGLFVYALKKHSIKFKTIRPQLKKGRKEKQKTGEPKGLFLYNCKCKGLQGGTLCGPVFCNFVKGFGKRKQLFWRR